MLTSQYGFALYARGNKNRPTSRTGTYTKRAWQFKDKNARRLTSRVKRTEPSNP